MPVQDVDTFGSPELEALDDQVCRLALERGFVEEPEVLRCREKLSKGGVLRRKRSLSEVLVSEHVLTPRQLERLRALAQEESGRIRLPGFQLLGSIGKGAHASVFKARQVSLDRLVAIKILPKRAARNPALIDEFRREGRAAAALNHPNIVQAFDVAQHGDVHFLVMEYVEGLTVHEYLTEHTRYPEIEALDIIIAMTDALSHAHARGLLHRDVKPKNIIITASGIPKLADLGLARVIADVAAAAAEEGVPRGTPYFMSPEQVRGDLEMGPGTDIYSLGATFFFMLTGVVPFEGTKADEVMAMHTRDPVRPPHTVSDNITEGISEVVVRMMAKAPSDRYESADELLTELRAWRAYHTLREGEMQQ